jgi:hypothetical protein
VVNPTMALTPVAVRSLAEVTKLACGQPVDHRVRGSPIGEDWNFPLRSIDHPQLAGKFRGLERSLAGLCRQL